MRAVEIFGDLNHEDMNVTAPASYDFAKEEQVAERLNKCLGDMVEEGFFDDCDLLGKLKQERASLMSWHYLESGTVYDLPRRFCLSRVSTHSRRFAFLPPRKAPP